MLHPLIWAKMDCGRSMIVCVSRESQPQFTPVYTSIYCDAGYAILHARNSKFLFASFPLELEALTTPFNTTRCE